MQIQLFITGRMYHLADGAPDRIDLPDDATLTQAVAALQQLLPEPLPDTTLLSVGNRHCGSIGRFDDCDLRDGDELIVVAPVAGG